MLGGYERNLQFVITPELCPLSGDVITLLRDVHTIVGETHSRVIAYA